jgi:hypothetical protein
MDRLLLINLRRNNKLSYVHITHESKKKFKTRLSRIEADKKNMMCLKGEKGRRKKTTTGKPQKKTTKKEFRPSRADTGQWRD